MRDADTNFMDLHRSFMDWSHVQRRLSQAPFVPVMARISMLYEAAVRMRLCAYERSLLKSETLPGFVVSIGNLTTGGTGKTPAVSMICGWARNQGFRPAILSRGYGGHSRGGARVLEVSDGIRTQADTMEAGDEPVLLARQILVPVVVSRQRYLAGLHAWKRFSCDFFVMDDGFQHLALKRDLDIVIIDAETDLGKARLLPLGKLREPIQHLRRADVFVLTHGDSAERWELAASFLHQRFPGKPVFHGRHVPVGLFVNGEDHPRHPGSLRGKRVAAFAGIAFPERFSQTLSRLGAEVVYFRPFPDHYPFAESDLRTLSEKSGRLGVDWLVTTEKDWVRLDRCSFRPKHLAYLRIRLLISPDEDAFFDMIRESVRKKGLTSLSGGSA
jgi:tetraacyldisaccharide 4'-kinase